MHDPKLKQRVRALRAQGKTYSEIRRDIAPAVIAQSTMSLWCAGVILPESYQRRIDAIECDARFRGRAVSLAMRAQKRQECFERIRKNNTYVMAELKRIEVAKIVLSVLYLCEGTKYRRGTTTFGNSDPRLIALYLLLMRSVFAVEESKLRCTVQCRADQDIEYLENFWHGVTRIPRGQFYRARIDARTVGKPTKKPEYKGVCRIDLFDGSIADEIKIIGEVVKEITGP
jgi:hypothetical protein